MKKAFTLIELIATIVILGVVTSIVSILIMNVIRNAKNSANRRNIDEYGRIIETSMAEYQSQYLKYPDSIDQLEIEYVGSVIECETRRINPDKTIYLSECKVNGKKVLDKSTEDGYYHYGTLVLTNEEYVDKLGKNIEVALKDYYEENNKYPINYRLLNLPTLDKDVICNSQINYDGSIYLNNCSVNGEKLIDYTYGEMIIPPATKYLLLKSNSKSVTNYTDGDIHEMYTFEHEATEQTPALTDYRYIGSEPNNYVEFNNELWRIIGVFKVEDENGNWEERVKLIRNDRLRNDKWNITYNNDWSSSSISSYLNQEYIINSDSNLIAKSKYYLGGYGRYTNSLSATDFYSAERGNNVSSNLELKYWNGNIGLIYPSDYIFSFSYSVDNVCYNTPFNCISSRGGDPNHSWMYRSDYHQWTINSALDNNRVFYVHLNGFVYVNKCDDRFGVVPVVYLKPNVKIISGDGTINNAYKLSM